MLVIHHLGISQSERIVWLCEELNVPYQLIRYERDPATRLAPPEYKGLHPAGNAPVIVDGALTLAESGAIIEYIIQKHGGGRLALTPDHPNYADYLYWLHYANASLLPIVVGVMSRQSAGGSSERPSAEQGFAAREQRAFDMMEARLGANDYFAGNEFTAADITMLLPLSALRRLAPRDPSAEVNICAYLKRIDARPAFQRAIHKADPGSPRQIV
jgi:glutathione S-transferase